MSRGIARGALRRKVIDAVRVTGSAALLLVAAGCDKPAPPPANDTMTVAPSLPSVPDSGVATVEMPWDSAAGPVFITSGPNASTASIVFPAVASDTEIESGRLDASPYIGTSFDLFSNGRLVGDGMVSAVVPLEAPEECSGWPLVQLSGVRDDSASRAWAVGLVRGRALAIPYDSISGLSSADSSRLAIDIARIASSVPGDTVAELRGLPYQVRRAYRFPVAPGVDGLIAEVWRTLNQEANPKQEHLLLVAERDSMTRGRFDIAYTERAAGGEETLESSEVMVIARFAPTHDVSVLLARYVGDGVIYGLLERTAGRRWRLRWTSPYVGC
ncbi:MAG: hypothetical protein IPF98_12225 [Gemmatimonadetes bacterium]|nr:hypothetical protein [Gemmatimonadota bacterium]MCC6769673.1 hypothetical protein [Gemmatimonadaceae bacterium]